MLGLGCPLVGLDCRGVAWGVSSPQRGCVSPRVPTEGLGLTGQGGAAERALRWGRCQHSQ